MKKKAKPHPESRLHWVCPFCETPCDRYTELRWCIGCYVEYSPKGLFDDQKKTERFAWAKALNKSGGASVAPNESREMDRTKYPRTFNFPWSGSESSDDIWWKDTSRFDGREVVITEKLDGEATTIYPDGHVHARSIDTRHHESRSWIKGFAGRIAHDIPDDHRICGENVYAWHSIFYKELPTYFFVYGIYDGDACLSWDDTEEICEMLDLHTVPFLCRLKSPGESDIRIYDKRPWGTFPTFDGPDGEHTKPEGYVVRITDAFPHAQFRDNCAKYVRENHVTTDQNWMSRAVVPNLLKL